MTNYTNGVASTVVTGTLGTLNATVDGATDLSNYASVRVQITGTFSGTVTFQSSVDGTTWVTRSLSPATIASQATITATATTPGIWFGDVGGRYFRVNMTAYTSGTATATILYSAAPSAPGGVNLNASVQPIGVTYLGKFATGSGPSQFFTNSAATTNATSVTTTITHLYEISITNTSATTAYWKLYNKASAPTVGTDVPILVLPVAAGTTAAQTFGSNGKYLGTGLAWALTGAMGTSDTTAVGTGILVSGSIV